MIAIVIICLQSLVDFGCVEWNPVVSVYLCEDQVADEAIHIGNRLAAAFGEDEIVSIWSTCLVPTLAA